MTPENTQVDAMGNTTGWTDHRPVPKKAAKKTAVVLHKNGWD